MIYAVINENSVSNIIVADEAFAAETDLILVPLQEGFGIGDTYRDGVFEKRVTKTEEDIEDGQISDSEALAIMLGEVVE